MPENPAQGASKSTEMQPFDGPVTWDREGRVLQVAADRSLDSVLHRLEAEGADWVVIVRTFATRDDIYYYVFRNYELEFLAQRSPERRTWPIERAVELHEWTSSRVSRGGRPIGPGDGQNGPAAARIVDYDASGRIVAIGELTNPLNRHVSGSSTGFDTTSTFYKNAATMLLRRGNSVISNFLDVDIIGCADVNSDHVAVETDKRQSDQASATATDDQTLFTSAPEDDLDADKSSQATEVDVTLSAETKAQIDIGQSSRVSFQIELTAEAMPLAVSQPARARADLPIVVSLSVENDVVEVLRSREFSVAPPLSGEPRSGFFTVRGVRAGVCRLAVAFRQGGSELGVVGLAMEVLAAGAGKDKAQGTTVALPRDSADDDKLALMVEQRVEGNQVFYDYTLHSEALGLPYRRVRSKPLLDRGGGATATALAFVERIYERVTKELKSLDDLKQLQREARALGASLCQELFDPEVAKLLWPLRDRINLVQIVSWEPYIPWELVRLRNPDTDEIDERFLCEYGLVRTLSDAMPVRTLSMGRWAYMGARYPMGSFPPVGAELDYFTTSAPESLRGHGITPEEITNTRDAFYDALADGEFDVLHISCHAESAHQTIERASLIIGDETAPGESKPRIVEVDTITVEAEARLGRRRPLVFLNACETGRVGPMLTAWGGWPNVFLRKGAGAFVGTSWAVRDKPAALFSTTFYNELLDGKSLAEAASVARAAAKKLGDASWLAFKVYGHPRARRVST